MLAMEGLWLLNRGLVRRAIAPVSRTLSSSTSLS